MSRTNYVFDAAGHLVSSEQQDGNYATQMVQYTYYGDDSLASLIYPSGRTITNCYDDQGRVRWVSQAASEGPCLNGQAPGATYAQVNNYHPHGAAEQVTLGNGLIETYGYNNRLQATSIAAGNLLSTTWSYGPTNNGNPVNQVILRGSFNVTQNYTYDAVNRLKTASEGSSWSQTYAYDHRGNRAVLTGSTIPVTARTPVASADNNSTVLAMFPNNQWAAGAGQVYDAAGNLTGEPGGRTFTYDAENRIIGSSLPITGSTITSSFVYDGNGRRISKQVGTTLTRYLYDGGGQLLAETNDQGAPAGVSYLTQDSLGSTRLVTDATAQPKECFDYFPFGEEISRTFGSRPQCYPDPVYPSVTTPGRIEQRFTGKERDSETGLDYFGARYFSGAQGRFTSPDEWQGGPVDPFTGQQVQRVGPLPYADIQVPQSLNKYAYVMNNPLRYTDPNGHCVEVLTCSIEGAALGSTVGPVGTGLGMIAGAAVGIYVGAKAGELISSILFKEQNRNSDGTYAAKEPGDARPGAEQEAKGLEAVGATKQTGSLTYTNPATGEKVVTIPDGKRADGQYTEVKSGGEVTGTKQINAMAEAAKAKSGKPLLIVVRPGARVSKPVRANPNIEIQEHPLK